jgi:PAS domain S-box-containing protein
VDQLLAPWRRETMVLVAVALAVTLVGLALGISLLSAMAAEETAQRETSRTQRDAQAILAAAGEGICGIDASGRVTFINPAGNRMLGWEGEDLIGRSLHAAVHHSHPDGSPYPEHECPITLTLRDGKTHDVTTETFWRQDGTCFPVEIVASAVMEDGTIVGAVLVFRDVSQRLESERALVAQSTELARSNSDLEQFAYVASHDLREPLRQVSSFVTLLERRFGASLDKDGRDYIAFARDGAKRMDRLIIDLLEFSRIGHRGLTLKPISITDAVDEAIADLTGVITETQASIRRDDSMPEVVAAQDELVRLFQNLISNALKYRHPDRRPEIAITARHNGAEWIIAIRDNGIGIDPQYGEKIFGIFQRLHTRDKFEGTGIGLAICKKIVEHLGGRIWVDSVAGEGSTFSIAIPDKAA